MARIYPQIGSQYFMVLSGDIRPPRKTSRDVTRPESEGDAFLETGTKAEPFELVSMVFLANNAAVATRYATYRGMINSFVTVVDRFGKSHTNIMVRDVRIETERSGSVISVIGGNSTVNPSGASVALACRWTLQATTLTT